MRLACQKKFDAYGELTALARDGATRLVEEKRY